MDELLELLFGQSGTPVRRDLRLHSTRDREGNPRVEALSGEAFLLSPEGSIDRFQLSRESFHACGCTSQVQVGGMCGEPGCGRISCTNCFTRCALCGKPLCLEHVRSIFSPDGARAVLCHMCEDEVRWRSLVSTVTLGLLPTRRL